MRKSLREVERKVWDLEGFGSASPEKLVEEVSEIEGISEVELVSEKAITYVVDGVKYGGLICNSRLAPDPFRYGIYAIFYVKGCIDECIEKAIEDYSKLWG